MNELSKPSISPKNTITYCLFILFCLSPAFLSAGELHKAARKGDLDMVHTLLEKNADTNQLDTAVGAPLHWAAARGHLQVAMALVNAGAKIDLPGNIPDAFTPLQLASSSGHDEVVKFLVGAGADLSGGTRTVGTPLHLAVGANKEKIVSFLLDQGADIEATSSKKFGTYPIHVAALEGAENAMDVLIKSGANVDTADEDGTTALHIAFFFQQESTARRLLEAGADPRAISTYLTTPIKLAENHPNMKALLHSLNIK